MGIKELLNEKKSTMAAQQAQRLNLKLVGFGMYADAVTGKVTHMIRDGQLVPVSKTVASKARHDTLKKDDDYQSMDKEGGITPHAKKSLDMGKKIDKEVDDFAVGEEKFTDKTIQGVYKSQEKIFGMPIVEFIKTSKCARIAYGQFLGIGHKVLNSFAAKQNVLPFDTSDGRPCRHLGDEDENKHEDNDQNYSNLIRTLDGLIDKCEIQEPMETYRGLSMQNADLLDDYLKSGRDIINLPCFTSVTANKQKAMGFSDGDELILQLPVGTKAMMIEDMFEDEEADGEMVLARCTKIKITRTVEQGEDKTIYYATVIGQ